MKKTGKKVVKKSYAKHQVFDDLVPSRKMDLWLANNLNVMFAGRHGVGKTNMILGAFDRANLRYAYFSGATMDPWIDFVGVPVKIKDAKTGKEWIELLRPKLFQDLNVQAIFIDEFNRTHKKVRNAVMELLQFKTINGKKIATDLRVVWAAINPEDEDSEYDVDRVDPAQYDRFHVHVDIPFQCSADFFRSKFGKTGETAVRWWNKLDEKIRSGVSPRRLEYALDMHAIKGDLRDVLPAECNPSMLNKLLSGKGYMELVPLLKDKDKAEAFFASESNFAMHIDDVAESTKLAPLFDAMPAEKKVMLLAKPKYRKAIIARIEKAVLRKEAVDPYESVLGEIVAANQNHSLVKWAKFMIKKMKPPLKGYQKRALKAQAKATKGVSTYFKNRMKGSTRIIPQAGNTFMATCGNTLAKAAGGGKVTWQMLRAALAKKCNRHCSRGTIDKNVNGRVVPWLQHMGYVIKATPDKFTKGMTRAWEVK